MKGCSGGLQLALLFVSVACLLQLSNAIVNLHPLTPWGKEWQPPVTVWLLSSDIPDNQELAWRKIGSKIWTFMSRFDHDFVDATGKSVPPALAAQRIFGPQATCGRFTRQFIRIPFHDCGTFDVGDTGSVGDTKKPRFGCNASLRWELAPCETPGVCVSGVEAAVDLATGAFLNETAFASLEAKYGKANVGWGQDPVDARRENAGFANAVAFLYQVKLETEFDEPPSTRLAQVSLADLMAYAGVLAVAKCGGPHIEFQAGRSDSPVFDAGARLPAPTEPLAHTYSYFWTMGLTNFDTVNLLAAHTTACFSVGCLDTTPSKYDADWVRQIMSVTTPTDPRICQFPAVLPPNPNEPNVPDGPRPGPPPVPMCFLPSDVEFNARADFRNYLSALAGQMSIAAAAAVQNPCTYQPGIPQIHGPCDVGVGVGYDFKPFRVVSSTYGPVNMCNRVDLTLAEKTFCPRGASVIPNFQNAIATSYFKMTKMYADATGAVAGARYGVARQPCQPGLIQIGTKGIIPPPSPACLCCPNRLPQDFNLGLEPFAQSKPTIHD